MLHVCVIVVFASLILRDQLGGKPLADLSVLGEGSGIALWLLPLACLACALLVHVGAVRALRKVEITNSLRPVEHLDTIVAIARVAAALLTACGIAILGCLDAVRSVIGDQVLIDEAVVVFPFLLMVVAGWWSTYPVERVLRDSTYIRDLDEGRPIYAPPSRMEYVWTQVRHQLFLLLIPMSLLLAWGEITMLVLMSAMDQSSARAGWLAPLGDWLHHHRQTAEILPMIVQLVGVALIASAAPLLIRRVWDTQPLRSGAIAENLLEMCRLHGITVRRLLVWRTGGTMINGAVLGLFGKARYILLTDALLDLLPHHYVQAVMAHEIGHVRCRHVFWLTASLFAASGMTLVSFAFVSPLLLGRPLERLPPLMQLGLSACSLAAAVVLFGWVSRRFEWQADAFAVRHLATFTPPTDDPDEPWQPASAATRPAVAAMCGALEIVAQANHLPRHRFTFRHGSIAVRVQRLVALEGVPLDQFPIDAAARRIKAVVALGCSVVVLSAFGVI